MPLYNQSLVCYELAAGNHIQSHQQPQPPSYLPEKKISKWCSKQNSFETKQKQKKKIVVFRGNLKTKENQWQSLHISTPDIKLKTAIFNRAILQAERACQV